MKVGEVNKLIFPLHRFENNKAKYNEHNDEMYDIHKEAMIDYIKLFII